MFKFLLILALIGYLFYKVGGLFFRAGAASQQFRQSQTRKTQDTASNVNANADRDKRGGNIKGGDYVDFEEVK